jgi:paraquat-inducible protein B
LATESLLTGLLYVDLDFLPEIPPKMVLQAGDREYKEIPTVPTQFEQIQEAAMRGLAKFDQLDLNALVGSFAQAAQSAHDLIGSPEIKQAVVSLGDAAQSLRQTSQATRTSLAHLDSHFDPLAASLRHTSDQAALAMQQASVALVQFNHSLDPESPLIYEVTQAARNFGDASQAIRDLAVVLERNPSVLVRGKQISKEK